MREQTTTWQRSIAAARKLQPAVRQIQNSLMFDVASTSILDAFHHVYLRPNKFNPILDSTCDCGHSKYGCLHRGAALLQYTSNLETRVWAGGDYIVKLEDNNGEKTKLDEANDLYLDLLDRYERCCDLLKAIDAGWNIYEITGSIKDRLNALKTPDKSLQQQLLAKAVS